MVTMLVHIETANAKGGEFRFVIQVSRAQRHGRPELASGTQQSY
jgi:hypothetical protein